MRPKACASTIMHSRPILTLFQPPRGEWEGGGREGGKEGEREGMRGRRDGGMEGGRGREGERERVSE